MPNIPLIPTPQRKEPQRAMNSIGTFTTGQKKHRFSRSKTHDPLEKLLNASPALGQRLSFVRTPQKAVEGCSPGAQVYKAQEHGPFGDATRKTGQSVTPQPHRCPSLHTQAHTRTHAHRRRTRSQLPPGMSLALLPGPRGQGKWVAKGRVLLLATDWLPHRRLSNHCRHPRVLTDLKICGQG